MSTLESCPFALIEPLRHFQPGRFGVRVKESGFDGSPRSKLHYIVAAESLVGLAVERKRARHTDPAAFVIAALESTNDPFRGTMVIVGVALRGRTLSTNSCVS
jgi:hypothetical protein